MSVLKKVFTILVSLMMLATLSSPTFASNQGVRTPNDSDNTSNGMITPQWNDNYDAYTGVEKSGNSVIGRFYAKGLTTTKITGTLYLEKYSGGRWTTVASKSVNCTGIARVNVTATFQNGARYRASFYGYIGSDNVSRTSTIL